MEVQNQMITSLDPEFIEKINFLQYYPPPTANDVTLISDWKETISFIIDDLNILLKLPNQRFWSQIQHDLSVHQCLVSYLQHSYRFYDINLPIEDTEIKNLIHEVHHLVFLIYLRMSTYKIKKQNFMVPEIFADIIYKNFIFDIPKVMDLCVLFGQDNNVLLGKMISNIFSCQRLYHKDLMKACDVTLQLLNDISINLGLGAGSNEHTFSNEILVNMDEKVLQDKINFIIDSSASLYYFFEIYPSGNNVLNEMSFSHNIIHFYEHTVMTLVQHLIVKEDDENTNKSFLKILSFARGCFIKMIRNLLVSNCIQPLLEVDPLCKYNEEKRNDFIECLLNIFTEMLSAKRFCFDYDSLYSIKDDLEILKQASNHVDATRIDYIIQGIDMLNLESEDQSIETDIECKFDDAAIENMADNHANDYDNLSDEECQGASVKPRVRGIELESLITQVKDLLPDLGSAFVKDCLEYFNYDSEAVINSLLEDNLPSVLKNLDRTAVIETKTPPSDFESNALNSRVNVFDNDEFDAFNNPDFDYTKVHIGKKNALEENILDNKKDIQRSNDIYQRYSNVSAFGDENDQMIALEYEDEYDDTYDSNMVGSTEPDADEAENKPFTIPRVLRKVEKHEKYIEPKENFQEEHRKGGATQKNLNFVEDPALLREKAEQRRQAKMHHNRAHDVKGKPKGQGQNENVTKNRAYKDKNKASRANHNRKSNSDKKYSKGMI